MLKKTRRGEMMTKKIWMATFLVALMTSLSSFAMAQYRDRDDDDDNPYYQQGGYQQARQNGYQNGYRDGYAKGRHEGEENDPNDYQTPDWRQATRGYQAWMGPLNVFQSSYREGYRNGFGAGFTSINRGWGDGDADDYGYGGGSYGNYPNGRWGHSGSLARTQGYNQGYQDGSRVAQSDSSHGKPFQPYPRGDYRASDHGYHSGYGDKGTYQQFYLSGYEHGYRARYSSSRW